MEIRLDGMVVDGTRCSSEALHVCMDGQCQVKCRKKSFSKVHIMDTSLFLVLFRELPVQNFLKFPYRCTL